MKNKKPSKIRALLYSWFGGGSSDYVLNTTSEAAGQQISQKTVLQLSAVWSCVRLISETISTLPLYLYEKQADGSRTLATKHPLYSILHDQPNSDSSACVFWEAFIVSMLLRGNGFAEKKYIGARLVALVFLSPDRLGITADARGNLVYRYTNSDGSQRVIPTANVFRVPGFTINGNWGLSAIEYGAQIFGGAIAAQTASNSTFQKGLAPTVAFKMERVLTDKQRDDFRGTLKKLSGALNAGESPLLEAGMDAKVIGINPTDAQLLETRQFSVEEVCRWFRVPPHMVGHVSGSTSWGTGIEQQMIGFLMFTLRPWLNRLKQAIAKDLLTPVEQEKYYAEFNVEGLLQADSAGRAAYLKSMTESGLMTRDEGRAKENLPPKGGNAAVLTVNSAQMPLDKLGQPKK